MVDNASGARDGLGKKGGWVPWLIAALLVMGGFTVLDLVAFREDIQDEAHEESEDHSEGTEEGEGTDLVEPGDEDAEADADH